jgi:hypothetical protein
MKKLTLACVWALGLVAGGLSGCGGPDNVQACEDWIDTVSCGDTDFHQYVNCDIYGDTDCDIADYFDCLTDNTTCDETTGTADTSNWSTCATKATCY